MLNLLQLTEDACNCERYGCAVWADVSFVTRCRTFLQHRAFPPQCGILRWKKVLPLVDQMQGI